MSDMTTYALGVRVTTTSTGEAGTIVHIGGRILDATSSPVCDVLMDDTGEVRTYVLTAVDLE
jgi:hypothetical protein